MLLRLVPFVFVLLWSSSFIAVKAGLPHISPLLFVAVRLSGCAVVLIATMLALRRSWRPLSGKGWVHCAIVGTLLNAIGLMPPHVAMALVPAAHIALVQSLTPLLTAAFGLIFLRERLSPIQWFGLTLGLLGVGLVVGQSALENATRIEGLALAFLGMFGLVAGTLWFGRYCRGIPLLQGATAQFIASAIVSAPCAWLLETPRLEWTGVAIAAMAWNTGVVSLGGMALYAGMLARGAATRATANFYLVPGVAAVLAWIFLGETLNPFAMAGLATASVGCWLVKSDRGRVGHADA
jgi:drug/metabolite transporter (DMT)-like permease